MRRKKEKYKFYTVILITIISLLFISVGYAFLSKMIRIQGKSQIDVSNSTGRWNITTSWVDNKIYYYQFLVKIDNKDGPVLDNEREISFKVPEGILIDRCNIWVAESKRVEGNRIFMKCFKWAVEQQPINLGFQLAFSKEITNINNIISSPSFKGKHLSNFVRDLNMTN